MDVLSELLKAVRLTSAVFFNAEFTAPWSFRSPPSSELCPFIGVAAAHVIVYHLVTDGSCWVRMENGPEIPLTAGDVVAFPHGNPHLMGSGRPAEIADNGRQLERIFSVGLDLVRMGGGGEPTRYVCGYMACEPQLSGILLGGLPAMIKVNIRGDSSGAWIENAIRSSVAGAGQPGQSAVIAKLSEALFVETLRRYLAQLPPDHVGALAAARDPHIGRALACMHREPSRSWSLAELARESGLSRTVFSERFRHYLADAPMAYLVRWRLAVAARLLIETRKSIAEIAVEAGYDSEAAFNRAFKRALGVPPARYRRQTARAAAAAFGGRSPGS